VETQPDDLELINAIFRGFHTIKGMGGFLGFTQLVHIAHESENVLDLLRNQELSVNPALMDIILEAVDLIKELLNDIRVQEIQTRDLSGISAKLATLMPGAGGESAAVTEAEADIEETSSSDPEDEALDSSSASFEWLQKQGVDASENASSDDEEPQEMPNSLQWLQEQDPNSQPTAAADADAEESDSEAWMETVSPDEFDAEDLASDASPEGGGAQEAAEIDLNDLPIVEVSSEEIGEITAQDLESTTQSQERVDGFLELGKDRIDKGASPSPSKSPGGFSTQPTVDNIISKNHDCILM